MIPFHTGMRVTGNEFCGRRQQLVELREYMESAGRVYVVGERRIGKTSLILEASRVLKKHRTIYADLMAVKTSSDVVQRLAAALVKSEKNENRVLALLKGLAHLQPTISVDPLTNSPTIGFSPGGTNQPETLDHVFSLIQTMDQPIVVFDEFQDVLKVKDHDALLARLRGLVQQQEQTSFVFSGSVRNSMEDIFTRDDSPFFQLAMRMQVGPLNRKKFKPFLTRKFARGGRKLAAGFLDTVLDICSDNPGAVQRFCTALWQATSSGQEITEKELSGAWQRLLAMQGEQYGMIMQELSVQQAQTLVALAKAGGRSYLSRDFMVLTGIALQPSVAKALKGLIARRVVIKEGTEYRIADPFLRGWLVGRG